MIHEIEIARGDLRLANEELERVREELRMTQIEIKRATQAMAVVVSLSQELRTPLNTIMGFAELLKSSMHDDDGNAEKILGAGRQMMALLDRIIPTGMQGTTERLEIQKASAAEPHRPAPASILYVEDNVLNFNLVERILAPRKNIKLVRAKNGESAVPQAREHLPALILLDLNLPDIHGAEVLRRLREDPATMEVPVVVISADATSSQIERLLAAGARNYMTKPFDMKRFLYTVDEVLAEQASRASKVSPALIEEAP